jgi:hypothetical protein
MDRRVAFIPGYLIAAGKKVSRKVRCVIFMVVVTSALSLGSIVGILRWLLVSALRTCQHAKWRVILWHVQVIIIIIIIIIIILLFTGAYSPERTFGLPFSPRSHIQTHGRTPGRVISPSQRPLPTQDNTTYKHNRQTSMPRAGFESATPATKRPQTYALDLAAAGIGTCTS